MRAAPCAPQEPNYTWSTYAVEQPVNHFDALDAGTFAQRVLVNAASWTPGAGGPVLVYAGNEGAIEGFANATGAMWDMAPELGAATQRA